MEKTYRVNLVEAFAQVPPAAVSVPEASTLASAAISRTWLMMKHKKKKVRVVQR
jgi:hypothetical protein